MSLSFRVRILGLLVLAVIVAASIGTYTIWHESNGNIPSTSSTTAIQPTSGSVIVTFTVQVVDANTSAPIQDASVYLNNALQGTTDSTGNVEVATIYPPTFQSYNVTALGYQDVSGTWTINFNVSGPVIIRLTHNSVSYSPVQWITVGKVQPVGYYLTLLQSNGSQPYVQLANEIHKLPDYSNVTAVAEIAYLALNATNPEVKEAFELMLQGGTPDPSDFQYPVPQYNTELEALYWLATQNQFKKDDTTALAIAMVDGLYITIGDDQTRNLVRADDNTTLNAARGISEWQEQMGLPYNLENYPLAAKLSWAWRGGMSPNVPTWNKYSLTCVDCPTNGYAGVKLDPFGYRWMTSDPNKMEEKRSWLIKNNLMEISASSTEQAIENYTYFSGRQGLPGEHWLYSNGKQGIADVNVNGVMVTSWGIDNPDFEFENLVTKGYGIGNCRDEAITADELLKSVGIASDFMENTVSDDSHTFAIFFDPAKNVWTVSSDQISVERDFSGKDLFYIFVPPFDQHSYLKAWAVNQPQSDLFAGNQYYMTFFDSFQTVRSMLTTGIENTTMSTYFAERNDY